MPETAIKSAQAKCPELFENFNDEIQDAEDFRGDLTLVVRPDRIKEILRFLKETPTLSFEFLMDLFGMDYLKYEPSTPQRYAVIYNLYSYTTRKRLRIKVYLDERSPKIDSLFDVYRAANWFEREAWDMFGIEFVGHPNLTRILCHHEFEGHPLRKDFPSDNYQRLKTALPSSEI